MKAPGKLMPSGLYARTAAPKPKPTPLTPGSTVLADVVFRLPRAKNEALNALAADTRVRKSEYMREAVADLLAKYSEELDGTP